MPSAYEAVDAYLSQQDDHQLSGLFQFLAIPSISSLSEHQSDMQRAADFLAQAMRGIGLENVQVLPTAGHPVVYGDWLHAPGRPTALVYGHYDVQPVDPLELWTTPPFAPQIRDGKLFARGASDDKGQVWMHLLAADALLKTQGSLPVNLKFLFEGEEEVGSRHFKDFVQQQRGRLRCDLVVISDTPMFARGVPSLCYGLRGLASLEFRVLGPAHDLHSGLFGGSVANPLHALAQLVASLHDEDGRVAVAGFYDDVTSLTPAERQAFRQLPFDEAAYAASLGVPQTFGEPGYSSLERVWARPTLEVNGMGGGFQGEGGKTIVPAEGKAKITCRLVPNQDPERILAAIQAHLEAHCPQGVRLEVTLHGGAPATVTPIDSHWVRGAAKALKQAFGREAAFIRMGGSIGVAPTFTEVLGAPLVLMGFGLPEENFHAPNEHFDLGNFAAGQRALAAYWLELGADGSQ